MKKVEGRGGGEGGRGGGCEGGNGEGRWMKEVDWRRGG